MSTIRPEPVRLDQALQHIGRSQRAAASRPQLDRFAPVWRDPTPVEEGETQKGGLVDEMFDFIMPELADAGLFDGSRYLDSLEDLAQQLEERSETAEEIDQLGALVLKHELKKHRLLWTYLNSLVDS